MNGHKSRTIAALALVCALPFTALHAQDLGVDYSAAGVAPGAWAYRSVPGGSEAAFMDSTGTVRLSIGCARAIRIVTVARTSAAPAATLSIWTSSVARVLPSRFNQSAMRVIAQTAAYDSLLDGIAFSRGRFAVSMPGSRTLVLAAAPQIARVVEDCRS